MSHLTYTEDTQVIVRLDGKIVGAIRLTAGGWQYTPKGAKTGGDFYPTLGLCKASLEDAP